jgi:hypothetical protein
MSELVLCLNTIKRRITMRIEEAIDIIRPEEETLEGIKRAFRAQVIKYHPDINPDGLKYTQLLTEAYEMLVKAYNSNWLKGTWKTAPGSTSKILNEMEEALSKLKACKGLDIEICGTWLWIGGETKYWAKYLGEQKNSKDKKMFFWAGSKQKWSWKPSTYVKYSKEVWSMDKIRGKFGTKKWDENDNERMAVV